MRICKSCGYFKQPTQTIQKFRRIIGKYCCCTEKKKKITEERPKHYLLRRKKRKIKEFIDFCLTSQEVINGLEKNRKTTAEERRIIFAKHRAKMNKACVNLSKDDKALIKKFYKECPKEFHVDHIIPLSKGGKHHINNLQYLFGPENIAKGNRICRKTLIKINGGNEISLKFLEEQFLLNEEEAELVLRETQLQLSDYENR